MQSKKVKIPFFMPVLMVLVAVVYFGSSQVAIAELSTLFTTPQERQIINANRYRNDAAEQGRPEKEPEAVIVSDLEWKEVINTYFISGIAISGEGFHSAWINDQEYMDGDLIEGKFKLKIFAGTDVKLRMTAPDGKLYYGTSGETLKVTYLTNTNN